MTRTRNALFIFFASILVTLFVALPFLQDFLKQNQILNIKREELRREEEYIEKLQVSGRELEKYTSKLSLIDQAIPGNPAIPSLIYYIEETSQNHGVSFSSIGSFSTSVSNKFPGLRETRLSFSVSGSYNDFKRFLRALESSAKIISVENFSISPSADDEERERFSFSVTIKTHSY